jgi:uncharacterized membrane protein
MAALWILVIVAAIYFAPTWVAFNRGHHQRGMVAVINTFLGWTLLGWVIALAIAVSAKREPAKAANDNGGQLYLFPATKE